MTHFSNFAYFKKKCPFLALDNWKLVTNLLIKAVTHVLLFSGVTAFNSFSADFKSMLVPRSAPEVEKIFEVKFGGQKVARFEP